MTRILQRSVALVLCFLASASTENEFNRKLREHYEHLNRIGHFPCGEPQVRVMPVHKLFSESETYGKFYYPQVAVLSRCDERSGSCPSDKKCGPKESVKVALPFKVTFREDTMQHKKGSWIFEFHELVNHTLCECMDNPEIDARISSPSHVQGNSVCGVSNKVNPIGDTILLIHSGKDASEGDFPWMAAIYTRLKGSSFEQICGGTLIDSRLVLTAAHCFEIDMRQLRPEDIRIGLGKTITDFNNQEPGTLIMTAKEIIIPERYVGIDNLYSLDIAIVVLSDSVITNRNIMPACIDFGWKKYSYPENDESGYFAGFGRIKKNKRSKTLKWALQKFLSNNICRNLTIPTDLKYITHDKFCALQVKGMAPSDGDSGGGITFVRNKVHYVYGLLSTKLYTEDSKIRLYTSLMNREHQSWLAEQWQLLQEPNYTALLTRHVSHIADFRCGEPQVRVMSVHKLFSKSETYTYTKVYFPDVTVLSRCDECSGSCDSDKKCGPKESVTVTLPFKVDFLEGPKKSHFIIEYHELVNHTLCGCFHNS